MQSRARQLRAGPPAHGNVMCAQFPAGLHNLMHLISVRTYPGPRRHPRGARHRRPLGERASSRVVAASSHAPSAGSRVVSPALASSLTSVLTLGRLLWSRLACRLLGAALCALPRALCALGGYSCRRRRCLGCFGRCGLRLRLLLLPLAIRGMLLWILAPCFAFPPDEHAQQLFGEDARHLKAALCQWLVEASWRHLREIYGARKRLLSLLEHVTHRRGRTALVASRHLDLASFVILVNERVEDVLEADLTLDLSEAEGEAEAVCLGGACALLGALDAKRRGQAQHQLGQHLGRNHAVGIGVVPSPCLLELSDVVGRDEVGVDVAERGEVFEDDGDDEVEKDEGADDNKGDEVGEGKWSAAIPRRWVTSTFLVDHRVVHQLRPAVASETLEEGEACVGEGDEVPSVS
mmetsp:Transcript_72792/g.144642  ORF Transcript_72792/g.144642 Transcript_72792/m.144642 type:complete len:407 (-) Transcript_72792:977-2197(-)